MCDIQFLCLTWVPTASITCNYSRTSVILNQNARQVLRFPEQPAARHLWASPHQFVVKTWQMRTSGKWTCVRFLQYSFKISFNSDSKQCRLNETCCNNNWTEIGGCGAN
jgi:hypothetical protein